MSAPTNFVATSGTGAAPITADNFNTVLQFQINYAGLKGFTGLANMTVYMQGYVSPLDGGQGTFYWNTTTGTDDGGVTTIVPNGSTSGCWSRIPPSTLILGVATNSNASAGYIGEYISSNVAVGSAVPITTATPLNITSISLTPGDWDVRGNIVFVGASSTVTTQVIAAINTVSATLPTLPAAGGYQEISGTLGTTTTQVLSAGITRVSLSVTTTIYLVAQATFTTSSMTGYGFIAARRVR